ncbi:MAG: hypothetical protein KDA24_19170 [Deltaproteobacteria bacterium]|nr:hypothetical protein [Deltaproteobacteria bacterium]
MGIQCAEGSGKCESPGDPFPRGGRRTPRTRRRQAPAALPIIEGPLDSLYDSADLPIVANAVYEGVGDSVPAAIALETASTTNPRALD